MLKSLALIAIALVSAAASAEEEGGGIKLQRADTDISNVESLQRGARNFMNYCSGCHSLKFVRYSRMAQDLHIPEGELKNLMFNTDKPFDTITTSLPKDAEGWFGKQPPDLSLIAREKGVDYLYSLWHGYYQDTARPWGVNNIYLQSIAMPHVLVELQGLQKAVFTRQKDAGGSDHMVLSGTEPMTPGAMKPEEYDAFVRDLVNFLDYCGEPIKEKRQSMGVFVMLFLLVFFVFAYLLKKEFWKDVH